MHEITDLEPHSDYVVRVRAKLGENKYSNFSDTAVAYSADQSMSKRSCWTRSNVQYQCQCKELICLVGKLILMIYGYW